MTSLKVSWKRKSHVLNPPVANVFSTSQDDDDDDDDDDERNGVLEDWRSLLPTKKKHMLEDSFSKSKRLMDEGIALAEQERFWESIRKFDEALTLTPTNEKLYEMKAQVLMELNEIFPAVIMAEKAVEMNKQWAEAYQTLARSQIGIGELGLALKNLCRAYHVKPHLEEIREDMAWCRELINKKKELNSIDKEDTKCCVCSKEIVKLEENVSSSVCVEDSSGIS